MSDSTLEMARVVGAEVHDSTTRKTHVITFWSPLTLEDFRALIEAPKDKRIAELERERDELLAHVDRLCGAESCQCGNVGFDIVPDCDGDPTQEQCRFCYENENSMFNVMNETPSQSLATIENRVIEECAKVCDERVLYTGYDCAEAIRELKR